VDKVILVDLVVEKQRVQVLAVVVELLEVFLTMTIRWDIQVVVGITLVQRVEIHMDLVAVELEVEDTLQDVDMQELVDMV
tara:strand:- start:171 stop:410 length:240 start_codon:yes stop_codon:yes gene_type:complete